MSKRRAFNMQLIGSLVVNSNENIPFNNVVYSWSTSGDDHLITYDSQSHSFIVPYAHENDYYVTYEIAIKTSTAPHSPIVALEFLYGNTINRIDYLGSYLRTQQITSNSIYHIPAIASPDSLRISLKVVGAPQTNYTLTSLSACNISSSIIILGL